MRRILLPILLVAVVLPAEASAKTERSASGGVEASVTYLKRSDGLGYRFFHLTISRQGIKLVDRPVRLRGCSGSFCIPWPGGFIDTPTVSVTDLDADREPEVVLDLYTGGAHCCVLARIFRFQDGRYLDSDHDFGDHGYRRRDLGGDGHMELVATDVRFISAFTAFASSAAPIRIYRYSAGRMQEVTSGFRGEVEADARKLGRQYRREIRRTTGDGRGLLAAYLADLYRLGRGSSARRILDRAVARRDIPFAKGFRRSVLRYLARWGYR